MLNVLLLQLPVPNNPGANIPLAAGYLKAWAHKSGLLNDVTIEIMPRAIADWAGDALLVHEIVQRQPDILGISLYTWNSERSLFIAARSKQRLPALIIIVGGPEVQRNNAWVLQHPAIDVAVEGEGEQTFVELLAQYAGVTMHSTGRATSATRSPALMRQRTSPDNDSIALVPTATSLVPGTIQWIDAELVVAPARIALASLDEVPSPYLLGFLELHPGAMALVECSRWCPYGCTFCLYGRNMGAKLGGRVFNAERILAEVAWAKDRGAGAIHFVEANLNLLPIFRELMHGLQQINADQPVPVYAELRGEHLKDEVVEALVTAGLHTAEVGLQSANQATLQAVGRRTDLAKWAEGTRRLYQRGVRVLLDVILGLPEDDHASTFATIDWIAQQNLGPYDIFTLQVLPGTGIRNDAAHFDLCYQERPPYYVLSTHTLTYSALRGLRWELRETAGLDPYSVEGLPEPPVEVWQQSGVELFSSTGHPIARIQLNCAADRSLAEWQALGASLKADVANHVVVLADQTNLEVVRAFCWPIAAANPTIHWDIIVDRAELSAKHIRALTAQWPHEIGYLDRVAVYRRSTPEQAWSKVSPRWWVVVDWQETCDPLWFEGVAEFVWRVPAAALTLALPALAVRGGTGIIVDGARGQEEQHLLEHYDLRVLNW